MAAEARGGVLGGSLLRVRRRRDEAKRQGTPEAEADRKKNKYRDMSLVSDLLDGSGWEPGLLLAQPAPAPARALNAWAGVMHHMRQHHVGEGALEALPHWVQFRPFLLG